jgi:hypothetical protein
MGRMILLIELDHQYIKPAILKIYREEIASAFDTVATVTGQCLNNPALPRDCSV